MRIYLQMYIHSNDKLQRPMCQVMIMACVQQLTGQLIEIYIYKP